MHACMSQPLRRVDMSLPTYVLPVAVFALLAVPAWWLMYGWVYRTRMRKEPPAQRAPFRLWLKPRYIITIM